MNKRSFHCVLLLILCVLLAAAPTVRSAEANEDSYIRAGGTVEGTDKIQRNGNVYTFTADVYGSVVVEKDDIVIDGAGYSVQGTGTGTGISLAGRTGVTVRNVEVSNFFFGVNMDTAVNNSLSNSRVEANIYGVYLHASTNNTITGCNITENIYSGVWLRRSSNNTINENSIFENGQDGIWLSSSSNNNRVSDNVIRTNDYGIRTDDYSSNVYRNNMITDNPCNLGVFGSLLPEFVQDIDDTNTVNGKPVIYWVNEHDRTVPFDAGYVALVNCTNITVQNLTLTSNGQGVLLASTTESVITQNNITDNIHGVFMCGSTNNTVYGNNITRNAANGVYIYYSQNNTFVHNNFVDNTIQVYDVGEPTNTWDNGTTGNFWSNYNGTDNDGDGVGDTPYVFDKNNQDNYPLVEPAVIPEFPSWAILPLVLAVTVVGAVYKQKLTKNRQLPQSD